MRYFNLLLYFFISISTLLAQKHDAIWLFGDDKEFWPQRGGMDLLFDSPDTPIIVKHYRDMDFWSAQASICDTSGKLLFYSNGCDIFNGRDQLIENGDQINAGIVHTSFCTNPNFYIFAYPSNWQTMLVLPQPEHSGIYYMFHMRVNNMSDDAFNEDLMYTKVDMNANLGAGKVLEKNISIVHDSLPFGELTAVKHGNGKDWWVVVPRRLSGTYYALKFSSEGITDTLVQSIGDGLTFAYEGSDQAVFSPDGSMLLRFQGAKSNLDATCQLRYFDRTNGTFTGYKFLQLNYDTLVYNGSCAISPSGQYGYIIHSLRVYQIDLWAQDIEASQTIVGWYDGFKDPVGIDFGKAQLGPDCKIYITGSGDTKYMHTIHNPDEKGLACNVELRSLVFPWPRGATLPFPPNYRLGPIDNPGEPCTKKTTASSDPNHDQTIIKVWPNPVSDLLKVQFAQGFADQIILSDISGKQLENRVVRGGIEHFWVGNLPDGLYFITLLHQGQVVEVRKVAIGK